MGYWRFNGNSIDYSGRGNDGTDHYIVYEPTSGRFGQGIYYTNLINYPSIDIDNSDFQFYATDPFTISVWVRMRYTSNGLAFFSNSSFSVFIDVATYSDPLHITFSVGSDTGLNTIYLDPSEDIYVSNWFNMIVTNEGKENTGMHIYINGLLTNTRLGSNNAGVYPWSAGVITFFPFGDSSDADIDEMIIENTAWDQKRITNYYNFCNAKFSRQ